MEMPADPMPGGHWEPEPVTRGEMVGYVVGAFFRALAMLIPAAMVALAVVGLATKAYGLFWTFAIGGAVLCFILECVKEGRSYGLSGDDVAGAMFMSCMWPIFVYIPLVDLVYG